MLQADCFLKNELIFPLALKYSTLTRSKSTNCGRCVVKECIGAIKPSVLLNFSK